MALALAAMWAAGAPAHAQLQEKMRELQQTKQELETSRAANARIAGNIEKMEREMDALGDEITEVAGKLQSYAEELGQLEQQLGQLEQQQIVRQQELTVRKRYIEAMLSTLVRLERIPKESATLMPASFLDKVRATRTLSMTTQGLRVEMDTLRTQLLEMKRLKSDISQRRSDIATRSETLQQRQGGLREVIATRKRMMESLNSENKRQQQAIAALIDRSESLQDLVGTLENARQEQINLQFSQIGLPVHKPSPPGADKTRHVASDGQKVKTVAPVTPIALPSIRDAKGRLRMPSGGKVISSFGQRRGINDTIKGVEIATRPTAQVLAPYDGEVLFTGPFRDYGNMVILRHSDNYHTLLAGLTELDCVPGQRVQMGEPVGLMGETIEARRLYMELRHAGKPTDPKPWIAGFASYLAGN